MTATTTSDPDSSPPPSAVMSPPPPPPNLLIALDRRFSLYLHTLSTSLIPRSILLALEISGDGRFFFPVILSLLLAPIPQLRPILLPLLLAALLDLAVIGIIKSLIRRPRPVYNKGMSLVVAVDHWSFPSGHSSRVFLIAAFSFLIWEEICEVLVRSGTGEEKVRLGIWGVCGWAVMTSVSRVLLGRHFVFDVVVGACLGVVEAVVAFQYLRIAI